MNQTMNAHRAYVPFVETTDPWKDYGAEYAQHVQDYIQVVQPDPKKRALQNRIDSLISYIYSCIQSGDWHGVRDAATDIEVAKAKLEILNAS